ncbi:hypothetical protein, partial [Klebsiella pneumoniae]|uniref:hypothetical protein n=1 Tax=Klebsiella pneumoniae TaxID=573 RepID=UPI00405587B6
LEFRRNSILTSAVVSSSKVMGCFPKEFANSPLTDFTPASQRPPKCGARGGINFQLIPRDEMLLVTSGR